MPAGYSSRCKTCNSPHRLDVEKWHDEGMSDLAISKRLKGMGLTITDKSLANHFNEHYNVQSELKEQYAEQYAQSQANLAVTVESRISEIEVLDSEVAGKHKLHEKLERILTKRLEGLDGTDAIEDLPKIPMAYVSLYTGCTQGICLALKTKLELLGEDSASKKANAIESWVDLMMEDDNPTDQGPAPTGSS